LAEISRQEPTSACSGEPAESDHEQRVTRSRLGTPQNRAWGIDARPAAAKNFLTYSLVRLGTDHVDVYRLVGLDPAVPIEDTIAAIAEFVQACYVRSIGLFEVGSETIGPAQVHPIADLQIEYSMASRDPEDVIHERNRPVQKECARWCNCYKLIRWSASHCSCWPMVRAHRN